MTGGAAIELALPSPPGPLRLRLHPAGTDLVSDRLRETRLWEPFETRLCLALVGPGAVCVDVGANLGYFTVLAAARATLMETLASIETKLACAEQSSEG